MKNILDRISYIAEVHGLTLTALESKIGASKGVLSRAVRNKTDIQAKWLAYLVENYPHVNSNWILTGKGDIFEKKDDLSEINVINDPQVKYGKDYKHLFEEAQKEISRLQKKVISLQDQIIEQSNLHGSCDFADESPAASG